jgi:hypothetical protein
MGISLSWRILTAANRWYSVRGGYAYYCLFDRLGDCRHAWDSIAFFVFFSFKGIPSQSPGLTIGWKRLILAEGPRQVLNAITLYSVAKDQDFSFDVHRYQQHYSTVQGVVMSFMLLTVAIWALSFIRLLVAAILYWPLLCCHIRGNLKEYCCHKVDKRITQTLADRRRRRHDPSAKPEKKKEDDSTSLENSLKSRPTLPKVELDGDGESVISMPLYPLSRSDSQESRRGLLRMDTASTMRSQLYRTDTSISNPRSLARTDTNLSSRTNVMTDADGVRQPTLPHLVGDFSIPEIPRPATASRPMSPEIVRPPTADQITRPPTAARVSPDFTRPSTATAPRIDTRAPSRAGPPSAGPPSAGPPFARGGYGPPPRSNTAESMRGYIPPPRSATNTSMSTRDFNPPPRSNTFQSSGYVPPPRNNIGQSTRTDFGPPPRSNTSQSARIDYGPPPRSNTEQSLSSGYTPRRPERPFSPNGPNGGYQGGFQGGYQGGYQAR